MGGEEGGLKSERSTERISIVTNFLYKNIGLYVLWINESKEMLKR